MSKSNVGDDEHHTTTKKGPVAVVAVPFPEHGHLNQMLQLSSIISAYGLPVYYVSSALHNRQIQVRINGLNPENVAKIHFHDLSIPHFLSPPPNNLGRPFAAYLRELNRPFVAYLQEVEEKYTRVVVVHDYLMSHVLQNLSEIHNAESYSLCCVSAFTSIFLQCSSLGLPFPLPHPKEFPPLDDEFKLELRSEEFKNFVATALDSSSGSIFNTSRLIEAPYVEFLERQELKKKKTIWAIGPFLPTSTSPSPSPSPNSKCSTNIYEWLDKQEPNSVILVSFGTSVSLSEEQINELAHGLERSKVKFVWVLRDADRSNRRAELPEGFEERVNGRGEGMVVREWAPQPQILAHRSIGGFMSHCGWNSCIESITMGVAIAAWPMRADQPTNAALIADILKTGILVTESDCNCKEEIVKASRIENVVRRLMASEDGDQIRKTAEELGAAVRGATEPGGASRLELDSFIAHITR